MYDDAVFAEHDGFADEPDEQPILSDAYEQPADAELAQASALAVPWSADPIGDLLRISGISARCPQPHPLDVVE